VQILLYVVDNKYMGKNISQTENFKYMFSHEWFLTQPLQKVAASAARTLYKHLMPKNIGILNKEGFTSNRIHVNLLFPKKVWATQFCPKCHGHSP